MGKRWNQKPYPYFLPPHQFQRLLGGVSAQHKLEAAFNF